MTDTFTPAPEQKALMGYRERGAYSSIQPEDIETAVQEWEDAPPDAEYQNLLVAEEADSDEQASVLL